MSLIWFVAVGTSEWEGLLSEMASGVLSCRLYSSPVMLAPTPYEAMLETCLSSVKFADPIIRILCSEPGQVQTIASAGAQDLIRSQGRRLKFNLSGGTRKPIGGQRLPQDMYMLKITIKDADGLRFFKSCMSGTRLRADQIYIGSAQEPETGNWSPVGLLDSKLWEAHVMRATTTAATVPVWRSSETPGLDVPVWTCCYVLHALQEEEFDWRSTKFVGLDLDSYMLNDTAGTGNKTIMDGCEGGSVLFRSVADAVLMATMSCLKNPPVDVVGFDGKFYILQLSIPASAFKSCEDRAW